MKFSSKFSHSPSLCNLIFSAIFYLQKENIRNYYYVISEGEKKKEKKFKESLFFFEKQLEKNPSYPIPVELIIK